MLVLLSFNLSGPNLLLGRTSFSGPTVRRGQCRRQCRFCGQRCYAANTPRMLPGRLEQGVWCMSRVVRSLNEMTPACDPQTVDKMNSRKIQYYEKSKIVKNNKLSFPHPKNEILVFEKFPKLNIIWWNFPKQMFLVLLRFIYEGLRPLKNV